MRQVDTRDFLKTPVYVYKGTRYTVKSIVKYAAEVYGGVHAGKPKTEQERNIAFGKISIEIGNVPAYIYQLKPIARVVLKALKPLKEAVEGGT